MRVVKVIKINYSTGAQIYQELETLGRLAKLQWMPQKLPFP